MNNKWTSTAGPIQTKKVEKLLSKIRSQATSTRRLCGIIGKNEYAMISMRMSIGTDTEPKREDVLTAWNDLGEKFGWTITRENYQQILEDGGNKLTVLDANMPTVDERKTEEQDVAQKQEWAAMHQRHEDERTAKDRAFVNALGQPGSEMVNVPDGHMAITLGLKYDNSDMMSDYFQPHASIGPAMVLLIVRKQAQTQALARTALALNPELCKMEWTWNTENYSMGHGNYLQSETFDLPESVKALAPDKVKHAHWEIEFTSWQKSFYPAIGYGSEPKAPTGEATGEGITIRRNQEHDGIEIQFSAKPDSTVLGTLKAHGFRWSMRSKVWYKRFTAETWAWAHRFAGLPEPQGNTDPAGAYVQAQEDAYQDAVCAAIGA